jgi:predicted LPLAT superfamily acyltransferase
MMLFLRYIGITPLYGFLKIIVPFYMLFLRKNRLAVEAYLKRMGSTSGWNLFCRTYRNHYYFAQAMVDRFALFVDLQHRYQVRISGNEELLKVLKSNKGAILAGAHVGNMEMAGYFFDHSEKRFHGIVFGAEAKFITGQRITTLAKHQMNMIPVTSDMSHVFMLHQALALGECVTLHCDRTILGKKQMEVAFLGDPALFPTGAFQMALRMDVPVLAIFMMREKSKHYHIMIRNLSHLLPNEGTQAEKLNAYVCHYVSMLEEVLKQYPEQWYNYFDFWKAA